MRLTVRRLAASLFLTTSVCVLVWTWTASAPPTPAVLDSLSSLTSTAFLHPAAGRARPDPAIRSFWAAWSRTFSACRPKVEPVQLDSFAHNSAASTESPGARKPSRSRARLTAAERTSLHFSHSQLRNALNAADLRGDAARLYNGTGIVTVAGGEYFGPSIVGLRMLREAGSRLPVEVFLENEAEYEPAVCEDVLPALGARCLVLTDFLAGAGGDAIRVSHYQIKSLAMLFSSFARVLYLDSDSIPLVAPEDALLHARFEPFASRGIVLWPDFWVASEEPAFWSIAGLPSFPPGLPKASSEAGQVLVNKHTHLNVLLLAAYYNVFGPEYYYPLLSQGAIGQGDKETFLAAAVVLNAPYYRVETPVGALGRREDGKFKGSAMIQYHPVDDFRRHMGHAPGDGEVLVRPAFVHANTPKFYFALYPPSLILIRMNAGHLVDEGDLEENDGKHLRLWGDIDDQERLFSEDLEKRTWRVIKEVGCQLENVIREWKHRKHLCRRLEEHWTAVFEEGESEKAA